MGRTAAWLLALLFAHANAATFTVTTLSDSGPGSLRQAVIDANGDTVSDTINFAVTGTIVLTSGVIGIYTPMTITGPGAGSLTIDGNQSFRIFAVYENVADVCATPGSDFLVTISGVTLTRGWRTTDNTGGAIYAEKSLTLDSVVVSNSEAKAGGGLRWAVVYASQALTITDSTFSGNIARLFPSSTSTSSQRGGAVYSADRCATLISGATIDIVRSTFVDNHVRPTTFVDARGAGLELVGNLDVTITDTRIVGNSIDPPPSPPTGYNYRRGGLTLGHVRSALIERTEISGNAAERVGGMGVYNTRADLQTDQTMSIIQIINSTIANNDATSLTSSFGTGGLALDSNTFVRLTNSTVSGNRTNGTAGGITFSTGPTDPPSDSNALPPTLVLISSIVSANEANDFSFDTNSLASVSFGGSDSLIGNLQSGITPTGVGNIMSTTPLLGPLAFNGGPTRTMALLAASPAIDTGVDPYKNPLTTDQRGPGFPRQVGPAVDIGAYEYRAPQVAAAPVPTLSESMLAMLALLTGIAGFAALQRRR